MAKSGPCDLAAKHGDFVTEDDHLDGEFFGVGPPQAQKL
jgi:hypothetical protein